LAPVHHRELLADHGRLRLLEQQAGRAHVSDHADAIRPLGRVQRDRLPDFSTFALPSLVHAPDSTVRRGRAQQRSTDRA
jgi:hypothetical protein